MPSKLRPFLRLHVYPALRLGLLILLASSIVDYAMTLRHGHTPNHAVFGDVAASAIAVVAAMRWSKKHEEELSSVEVYQAHAYMQHLKINNAVTNLYMGLSMCDHGADELEHKKCVAHMRLELRKIQVSLGKVGETGETADWKEEFRNRLFAVQNQKVEPKEKAEVTHVCI